MIFGDVPDILLDNIAEVNAMLEKYKVKTSETNESYKFWKNVAKIMKLSWGFMVDMDWVWKEAQMTKSYNEFLVQKIAFLEKRLSRYETVTEIYATGNWENVINNVDKYMNDPEIIRLRARKKELKAIKHNECGKIIRPKA